MSSETPPLEDSLPPDEEASGIRTPLWASCTPEDTALISFEEPISAVKSATPGELADTYLAAARNGNHEVSCRVYELLGDLLNLHLTAEDRSSPFGPIFSWSDGRRTAIPTDFSAIKETIAVAGQQASNPVLRARLNDIAWVLDRKRWQSALSAIDAYCEVVRQVRDSSLSYQFPGIVDAFSHQTAHNLERAVVIGRAVGAERPQYLALMALILEIFDDAVSTKRLNALLWFGRLELMFGVSGDTSRIAAVIEEAAGWRDAAAHRTQIVELWRLAARLYAKVGRKDEAGRCLTEAAERLAEEAEELAPSSALGASHVMAQAIAQLAGVTGRRERRRQLQHRLVDFQADIANEMTSFSQDIDLSEMVDGYTSSFKDVGLVDSLLNYALLERLPTPEQLIKSARERVTENPISNLFSTSHLDHEGKVVARTGPDGADGMGPIRAQIAMSEAIRRQILVAGGIEIVRVSIRHQFYLSAAGFERLLEHSPAVPSTLLVTFSRGVAHFFNANVVEAAFILIPMLEAILRHILKSLGHDVTVFDDASQTQKDRTLSELLKQMRPELDSVLGVRLTTDIENVFLNKPGPHLRHVFAHGLLHDGVPYSHDVTYACWLIYRLAVLPLVSDRERLGISDEWIQEA